MPSKPGLVLTDTSPNGRLVYRGNPISWLVDLASCIPFLSLSGSGSQASIDAAAAQAASASTGAVPTPDTSATAPSDLLGPFGGAFGLGAAPTTVPGQAGSMGTPSDSSTGNTPLASAQQDVNAFLGSLTPQQAAAAARPNTATPVASTSAVPRASTGPLAYVKRALGGH